MPKAKAQIGIVSIQKKYLLPFEQVQRIAIEQGWESLSNRAMMYDRATVEKYFKLKGIKPKTFTWKEIAAKYKLPKEVVFEIIKQNKIQPLSAKGALWSYPIDKVVEVFKDKTNNK